MEALRLFPQRASNARHVTSRRPDSRAQRERQRSALARQLAALQFTEAADEPIRERQRRESREAFAEAQRAYDAARLTSATTEARLNADASAYRSAHGHIERQLKALADPLIDVALVHLTRVIEAAARATPTPTPAPTMLAYYEAERQLYALAVRADVNVRDEIDAILATAGLGPLYVD